MTKKGDKTEPGGATGEDPAAGLRRDLALREQQLRDLTEQSLGFLEELAESRRRNIDRDELARRLGELEQVLADARRRVRHAGGVAEAARDASPAGSREVLEVVFWGGAAHGDAIASQRQCGEVPVAWVGPPDAVPARRTAEAHGATNAEPAERGLHMIAHRDARTPAQCWNLGMAATSAEHVLFVGPGHRLRAEPRLPGADAAPNTALLCPRIEVGPRAELGCEEVQLLRLRPREAPSGSGAGATKVPWPSAGAFVVRRAAFERIGLFDEGLLGPAALLDFTLRARQQNFEVLGVPTLTVERTAEPREAAAGERQDDEQRLLVLAAHRPASLGLALADAPLLWQMERAALPGYLAQLLSRARGAEEADARAVVEQVALGLVQHSMPVDEVCARVRDSRLELWRGLADVDLPTGRDQVRAALRAVEQQVLPEPLAAFAVLLEDLAQNRRVVASAVQVLQQQLQQAHSQKEEIDVDRHAQLARAERAEGARAAVQTQLDQVQVWLREAHARLEEQATTSEKLHHDIAEVQRQLEASRGQLRELEARSAEAERAAHELTDEVSAVAQVMGLASTERGDRLKRRLAELHEESVKFAETLRAAGAADSKQLLAGLDALSQRVQAAEHGIVERDRQIVRLLAEVQTRRLFPRALSATEQALLDRMAREP
ncbi:MAG TPA: hypothetical protein VFZ65_21125 [Planctomycetota bacterium]|nr:hypothetical protein [Planctomycetota bacterium]